MPDRLLLHVEYRVGSEDTGDRDYVTVTRETTAEQLCTYVLYPKAILKRISGSIVPWMCENLPRLAIIQSALLLIFPMPGLWPPSTRSRRQTGVSWCW